MPSFSILGRALGQFGAVRGPARALRGVLQVRMEKALPYVWPSTARPCIVDTGYKVLIPKGTWPI